MDNTLLKAPVQIGRLQRYATDSADAAGAQFFEAGPASGRHVAVIGAGPAGLTCAHELRRRGHAVTVFEARELPGGLNTYGIAAYKYDTQFALAEAERALSIGGIDLRLNRSVDGKGIARLLGDFDAVFRGSGLGKTMAMGIDGEDLAGVWEALDFIFQTHTMPLDQCVCGERVIVIGGGNTAVDAATAAVRLGAREVTIAYRRTAAEMPAFEYEYELTKQDGIHWEFSAAPLRITSENGAASGVEFATTHQTGQGRSAKLKTVAGSNRTLAADMVIKALGQEPLLDLLKAISGLKVERGRIVVDGRNGRTSVPKLFAGGDCISKGAEVVDAVQEGKVAAAGIHEMLSRGSG